MTLKRTDPLPLQFKDVHRYNRNRSFQAAMEFFFDWFIYETPIMVTTHNKVIAGIHLFLQIIIFVFIFLFVFFYGGGHIYFSEVRGALSFQLNSEDSGPAKANYCGAVKPCTPVFASDLLTLRYRGIFIPTRFANESVDAYVSAPENVVFSLRTSLVAYPRWLEAISEKEVDLDFMRPDGTVDHASVVGQSPPLTIDKVLRLAGSSLNQVVDPIRNLTLRDTGGLVVGVLRYTNYDTSNFFRRTGVRGIGKFYLVKSSTGETSYHLTSLAPGEIGAGAARSTEAVGIQVDFIITGYFGHPDFNTAYIQLITSLAFFRFAIYFIDLVLFRTFRGLRRIKLRKAVATQAGHRQGFLLDVMDHHHHRHRSAKHKTRHPEELPTCCTSAPTPYSTPSSSPTESVTRAVVVSDHSPRELSSSYTGSTPYQCSSPECEVGWETDSTTSSCIAESKI